MSVPWCVKSESKTCVSITDIFADGQVESVEIRTCAGLQEFLKTPMELSGAMRIFWIAQKNSWNPLNITEDMLNAIFSYYNTMPELCNIVRLFKDRNVQTEDGMCYSARAKSSKDFSETCYIYKYADAKQMGEKMSWVIRQTGVYQRLDRKRNHTVFLMLCPFSQSKFEVQFWQAMFNNEKRLDLLANPNLIHLLVVSSYFSNWRDFQGFLEHELTKISNRVAVTFPDESLLVTHQTLLRVGYLKRRLLPLRPILISFLRTISTIVASDVASSETIQAFQNLTEEANTYLENTSFLIQKAEATAEEISHTLAQDQSNNVLQLTRSTVTDSITIRIITLMTLFYLPFSFIATIMGMNFFVQDPQTHHIIVSPQLWVYFGLSIPLTIMTIAFWKYSASRRMSLVDLTRESFGLELDSLPAA